MLVAELPPQNGGLQIRTKSYSMTAKLHKIRFSPEYVNVAPTSENLPRNLFDGYGYPSDEQSPLGGPGWRLSEPFLCIGWQAHGSL